MVNVEMHQSRVLGTQRRRELWLKEDWWEIWLGLGIVVVAYALFANGASIHWIAVTPAKWSWIGIWAFVLAIIATTRWDRIETKSEPQAAEIWRRFPKFVIGFLLASLLVTAVTSGYADYNKSVVPSLVGPIKDLRTWAFIFCFLSIGLTTRFGELSSAGKKPFVAFKRRSHRQCRGRPYPVGVRVRVALGKSCPLTGRYPGLIRRHPVRS